MAKRPDRAPSTVVYLGATRSRSEALACLDHAREFIADARADGMSQEDIDVALRYAFRDVGRAEGIRLWGR